MLHLGLNVLNAFFIIILTFQISLLNFLLVQPQLFQREIDLIGWISEVMDDHIQKGIRLHFILHLALTQRV